MTTPAQELHGLLGDVIQICLVARDLQETMERMVKLGIGPWALESLGPANVTGARYRGEDHSFTCRRAYTPSGNLMWEIVEPVDGTSIFHDFLERRGEGVHHLGFSIPAGTYQATVEEFARRGFALVQSGRVWDGRLGYAFVSVGPEEPFYFEIWDRPVDFQAPASESWYPTAPAV